MNTNDLNTQTSTVLSDEELEKKLHSLKTWYLIKKTIPVITFVGFVVMGICASQGMWNAVFATIVIALALSVSLSVMSQKQISALRKLVETAVTLPVIKEVFEVRDYQPRGHIKNEIIRAAGLVNEWEKSSGSDYIEGSYKGINILYSDLRLWHTEIETDSDGKESKKDVTDFKGQWIICDFGKELSATLRLIERKGGTKLNRTYDASKSSVETENTAFNKKFRIITNDGHTAFYLLTPQYMEQLVAADEAADSSTLFCFMDGKVHIALYSGRDSFELKGVKLDSADKLRQKFRRDLKYITDLMDELLRNDKLFKEA